MVRVEILDAKIYYTEVQRRKLSGPLSINVTWKSDVIVALKKRVELKPFTGIKHDNMCSLHSTTRNVVSYL